MEVREGLASGRDGTAVWWREAGRGGVPVVLTDGIACSGFIWDRLFPALAERGRVLHWNYRGHGKSGRPADPGRATVADCVDDLLAVLDAAGAPRAVLAGHSMGVMVALEAHRRAPERVAALVLACGSPAHPLETFHGTDALARVFPVFERAVLAFPSLARLGFRTLLPNEVTLQLGLWLEVNRSLVRRQDLQRYLEDASRVDPEVFVRLLASAGEVDATDHLPDVDVPALVVGGERDHFTPVELSRRMADALPDAEYLLLPGASHMGPLEHPELLELRLARFLDERVAAPAAASDAA
jgi:pimeloyl-ACP methyl ester carboxylesterase